MALRQYTVTLTGSNDRAVSSRLPFSFVRIESESVNDPVRYGTADMTNAEYAGSISPGPLATVQIGPMPHGVMLLENLYFRGTSGNKIHLMVVTP